MKASANNVVEEYLNFGGEKTAEDFKRLLKKVANAMMDNIGDEETFLKMSFILQKLEHGLEMAASYGKIIAVVDDTEHDLQEYYEKHARRGKSKKGKHRTQEDDLGKLRPPKNKDLGKLVDEGKPYKGRADEYWKGKIKQVFTPDNTQVRSGADIPKNYEYDDIDFLKKHYGIFAIEFGNWLSQQDRKNYLGGLGLSLFDLYHILNFTPKQISLKGKLSVAFGARGRGNALAHFENQTFTINLTRYSRPKQGSTLKKGFDRTTLLVAGGGMGSFAHEYGHALDYYGGMYAEPTKSGALSGARSLRIEPDKKLMAENSLEGFMEKLLFKIIWKNNKEHSEYYKRLEKAKLTEYYFRRNELFARAFETYVHYKMNKKKYKNIFLAENKYEPRYYLTPIEMRRLEGDFDKLFSALKNKL